MYPIRSLGPDLARCSFGIDKMMARVGRAHSGLYAERVEAIAVPQATIIITAFPILPDYLSACMRRLESSLDAIAGCSRSHSTPDGPFLSDLLLRSSLEPWRYYWLYSFNCSQSSLLRMRRSSRNIAMRMEHNSWERKRLHVHRCSPRYLVKERSGRRADGQITYNTRLACRAATGQGGPGGAECCKQGG